MGSPVPGALTAPLMATAAGAAILKYRLYDIDPVINKSLVFGAMAVVVTAGYAVVVTGVGRLVDGYGTLLSLIATGLVAVAFEPLRRRVKRVADRLVYGRRATPYEALARLSAHLAAPAGGLLRSASAPPWPTPSRRVRSCCRGPACPANCAPSGLAGHVARAGRAACVDLTSTLWGAVTDDGGFRGAITVVKAPARWSPPRSAA